jgi:cytochrome c oxidase cbb3-type subunit 4
MIGIVRGLITVALLILFLMLVAWAWSGRRKQLFDSMARMPLEEDTDPAPAGQKSAAPEPGSGKP